MWFQLPLISHPSKSKRGKKKRISTGVNKLCVSKFGKQIAKETSRNLSQLMARNGGSRSNWGVEFINNIKCITVRTCTHKDIPKTNEKWYWWIFVTPRPIIYVTTQVWKRALLIMIPQVAKFWNFFCKYVEYAGIELSCHLDTYKGNVKPLYITNLG